MQLTHLSVVSVLAAASGANALPTPALSADILKFFGFGSSDAKAAVAPGAPAYNPVPAYNTTGSYNATGNLTARFHARAVDVAVVSVNATGNVTTTNGTAAVNVTMVRRAVPAPVVVPYNATVNATAGNLTSAAYGIVRRAVAGAVAAVDSAVAAGACSYPAQYTLTHFSSFALASNASTSYISFAYADAATALATQCAYNASSASLTAGTGLAPRYPCDDGVVSFIWEPAAASNASSSSSSSSGKLTMIEETCPGATTTKFESSGSVAATSLRCTKISGSNATAVADLSAGTAGMLCSADGALVGNFTSLQPSPL